MRVKNECHVKCEWQSGKIFVNTLIGNRQTDRQTMSPIELFWTAKNEPPKSA